MQTAIAPTPKNGSVLRSSAMPVKTGNTNYSVLMTTNYDLFKIMADNRNVNLLHINRLVESMKAKQLICPIIVNAKHEIIDGQHRYYAIKELGLPVYYIVIPNYGIKEVQILNTHQKNWQKLDYLHSYCAAGRRPYLEFQEFMKNFPELSFQACERLLTFSKGRQGKLGDAQRVEMKDFEQGKLVIPDLQKSYSYARRIMDFKPFYNGFHKGIFASVMLSLFKSKNYNHKEMIHKLSVAPIKMQDCLNVEGYKMLMEDIYNHKRLKENKVSFRYE